MAAQSNAAIMFGTRFAVVVPTTASTRTAGGPLSAVVDGLDFALHPYLHGGTVYLMGPYPACKHVWRSGNLLSVRDLGDALAERDNQKWCDDCQPFWA